ncbi:MAG TPA: LamG domain-containing protein [Candidatus Thermoplasmatota archaeon]|jgi:hypothetical protein|nr:LamG domain-containing protein [Candidatus Thermoplasmatota archaeon]
MQRERWTVILTVAVLAGTAELAAAVHCGSEHGAELVVAGWFFHPEDYLPLQDATQDCRSGRLARLGSSVGPDDHDPAPAIGQTLNHSAVLEFHVWQHGSSDYLVVSDTANLKPASFTWAAWVYPLGADAFESYPVDESRVMSVEVGDTGSGSVALYYAKDDFAPPECPQAPCGRGYFGFVNDACGSGEASRKFVNTSSPLDGHDWYFIAGAFDATQHTMSMYYSTRMGTPVREGFMGNVPDCFVWSAGPLVIGARSSNLDLGANAQLDAVRVFSKALSAEELADEMWWL